jgi:hypothetical protein
MMRLILVLVLVVGGFFGAVMLAGEWGGEVVVLTTRDEREVEFQTSLWVVEHRGSLYLRAGDSESGWYARLKEEPRVKLERNGETRTYRAHPDPRATQIVIDLMAQDYGFADRLIGVVRDNAKSVAIRLEPIQGSDF